jgi:hypothetical protein
MTFIIKKKEVSETIKFQTNKLEALLSGKFASKDTVKEEIILTHSDNRNHFKIKNLTKYILRSNLIITTIKNKKQLEETYA